jgi:hypothetical protein
MPAMPETEIPCDVAVIGGGTGGCAAALAALEAGMRVVLAEETEWLGGQLTSQGVPPDEHVWIEVLGATRSYRAYRDAVRGWYRRNRNLSPQARNRVYLNPGDAWVSRLAHEPRVSAAVLDAAMEPRAASGKLRVLRRHRAISADVSGDSIESVTLVSLDTGHTATIRAPYFLDATETGELLPLTGTEYVTGTESRRETGEFHAPPEARPSNVQAVTWCLAVDHVAGEDHTIERPDGYSFWRDYLPALNPTWPGRLLDWTYSHPLDLSPRSLPFDPDGDRSGAAGGLWTYRRIAHRRNFHGSRETDVTLVNWPQNDYWLGNTYDVPPEEAERHMRGARQLTLSLLYWMQTEAPRPDGGCGWPGLRPRGDVLGTPDGLAKAPYVRESRRIRAKFTVLEQHVGVDARRDATGCRDEALCAERFDDSVGIGSYRIDLHPSTGGDNYIDVASLPFQIPLGALLPVRMRNLLPASKNIGTTHITNGCYRLHPVEWNVGEVAGALAALAVRSGNPPRKLRDDPRLLREFQSELAARGVELEWPPGLR